MAGKKYVPQHIILVCDKGALPSELVSFSHKETTMLGENMCTKVDKVTMVNFKPFGPCSCKNGTPCVPAVTDWTNLSDFISIGPNELLLEDSELPCTLGGTIKIFYSMQAAAAHLPEQEEEGDGFWGTAWSFTKGLGSGLWKGLKGTVIGAKDLVVWAGKHSLPYMLLNPEGYQEQLQKDKETFEAIGNAVVKAGTWAYRSSAINQILDPEDWMEQQRDNKKAFDSLMQKASEMDAEEWGDFTGQVLFEVIVEVATVGGASVVTAAKVADRGIDAARALNALEKVDDVVDGGRALETIQDGKKFTKAPEELGDVVHVPKKKPSYKHGQSDGGPGTWQKETTPQKGADYQEKVTGAPKDTEYVVQTDKMKSGKKKFDGYDPETNTLTDAKDWDGWPPEGQTWAERKVTDVARKDLDIANGVGANLEYHVPTQSKADQLNRIFRREGLDDIDVIVTPK